MDENKARIEAIRLLAEQEGYELVKKSVRNCDNCKYGDLTIEKYPCNNCDQSFSKFEPEEVSDETNN